MRKKGLRFKVSGEYVDCLKHADDPEDENWQQFEMHDLHPAGCNWFTIWTDHSQITVGIRQEMIARAVTVVDWMHHEKGWDGFCADLFLVRAAGPLKVHSWELL